MRLLCLSALVALLWHCSIAADLLTSLSRRVEQRQKRCTHVRTYHMLGADCCELNIAYIPQDLKVDIEILDATFNRIRELHNTSFLNYPSIRFLYLADNSIAHIESGTFDPLFDLEVLDLTLNSLHSVPDGLQNLASLWKLLLAQNPLSATVFFESMPLLEVLSLAQCKQKKLPNLNALPGLKHLNFSYNNAKIISVPEIASLCRLKELDVRGNERLFRNDLYCDCVILTSWTENHGIKLHPTADTICLDVKIGSKLMENTSYCFTNETEIMIEESESTSRSCETEVLRYAGGPMKMKSYLIWIIVAVCSCTSILACCLVLYCTQRRQKNRQADRQVESEILTSES